MRLFPNLKSFPPGTLVTDDWRLQNKKRPRPIQSGTRAPDKQTPAVPPWLAVTQPTSLCPITPGQAEQTTLTHTIRSFHPSAQEGIPLRLACQRLQSVASGSLKAALAADCLRHRFSRCIMSAQRAACQSPRAKGLWPGSGQEKRKEGDRSSHLCYK